ncbi:MAG TPA: succinate dehydrogenase assembly factor 2 [Methylophilaceae bacterium]|jgi:succinate dehydrogenase flavin-adding protein (antitoxin of CptAB toxin-antitoxin module)
MSVETQRMQWRCRRGLLELDIVLGRFVSQCYEHLTADQLHIFNDLLDYTDNELLDLIINRTQSPEAEVQELVLLMRNAPLDLALQDTSA